MVQESIFDEPTEQANIPFNVSLLQSALQKCVRRHQTDQAVRIAKSFIEKDPVKATRRIYIIVPEETLVHPLLAEMPEIIKKAQANKPLSTTDIDIMLTLIRDATDCEMRDFYVKHPRNKPFTKGQWEYMSDTQRGIVGSLEYRATIGGMRNDITMLQDLARVWVDRFTDGWRMDEFKNYFEFCKTGEYVDSTTVDHCTAEDLPYYAMDFHWAGWISAMLLDRTKSKQSNPQLFENNEVKKFIDDNVDLSKIKVFRKYIDKYDEVIYKTMWLYEISVNPRVCIWKGRAVNWAIDNSYPEPPAILDSLKQLNEFIKPRWEDIFQWYINKELENDR